MDSKSLKYYAVSNAILEIIEKEGVSGLNHSQVSRLSKVSRAWIYEYMGREKEDLVRLACEIVGDFFSKTSLKEVHDSKLLRAHLINSQEEAFENILNNPLIIRIYFRFKGTATTIGQFVEKYEKLWINSMSKKIAQGLDISPDQGVIISELILTLRLGFYHRIASSDRPEKEILKARAALQLNYDLIFAAQLKN